MAASASGPATSVAITRSSCPATGPRLRNAAPTVPVTERGRTNTLTRAETQQPLDRCEPMKPSAPVTSTLRPDQSDDEGSPTRPHDRAHPPG